MLCSTTQLWFAQICAGLAMLNATLGFSSGPPLRIGHLAFDSLYTTAC